MSTTLAHYWKAIIAFVAPGVVIIGSAVNDASDGGSTITTAEIVTALVAMVVTSAGVAVKQNAPREDSAGVDLAAQRQAERDHEIGEAGL